MSIWAGRAVHSFAHRCLPEKGPINWSACEAVECVHGRCGGLPVLRGTRRPVSGVLENLEDGMSFEEFAEGFEVDEADVRTVFRFWSELSRLPLAS